MVQGKLAPPEADRLAPGLSLECPVRCRECRWHLLTPPPNTLCVVRLMCILFWRTCTIKVAATRPPPPRTTYPELLLPLSDLQGLHGRGIVAHTEASSIFRCLSRICLLLLVHR